MLGRKANHVLVEDLTEWKGYDSWKSCISITLAKKQEESGADALPLGNRCN